jgi:hypothetical protein
MYTVSDKLNVDNVWIYKGTYRVFESEDKALSWFVNLTGESKNYGYDFLKKCDQEFIDLVEDKYN